MAVRTGDSFLFLSKEVTGEANWPHADGIAVFTFLVTGVAAACILPQKKTESNRAGLKLPAEHLAGPTCEVVNLCYVSVDIDPYLTGNASRLSSISDNANLN